MKQLLKEVAIISAGQGAPQGDDSYCKDGIPFVKAGNLLELLEGKSIWTIQKVSDEIAQKHKLKLYKKGTVLFAKSGMSCLKGYVYVLPCDAYVVSHLACITPKEDISDYLLFYFNYHKPSKLIKDEAYPSISLSDIGNLEIDLKKADERAGIVTILSQTKHIIDERKEQLHQLDELVKARFVEMFGDPIVNEKGFAKVRLDSEADIKIGPFGSLLHQGDYIENGHALVNPSHIIGGTIQTDSKLTISNEKYEDLSAYHLKVGDIVMGRRGEMGRCAVVREEGLLCGTGSLIIRTKGCLKADFIQKIISFPSYKKMIEDKSIGQTMQNLNVPIVSSFEIIKPAREIQDSYYLFVTQVDRAKVVVQRQIKDLQELFDKKMEEYFGRNDSCD